tara:strand:+ start:515 stop:1300 length:786 start_codon:yes stop_codon:yes gene_type:complete
MYAEFETKTSYRYLQKVISVLQEPICILGGWAVFLHVNKNFQKAQGRPYLGSRDVDLGFHFDKNATVEQMENSSLAKSMGLLQKKLKFKPVSFRMLKEVHTETEEEIAEGQIIPAHFIFPMYIDLMVDNIPPKFKETFHFQPADEPLLRFVFENPEHREQLKEFTKKLWLPKPELLLATKINALKHRDKEHKKTKDICDIFALLWYSKEKHPELKEKVTLFVPNKKIHNSLSTITKSDYQKASQQVNHSVEEIKRVIELLL